MKFETTESLESRLTRKEYVDRYCNFYVTMKEDGDERELNHLGGLYEGKSQKIHNLIRRAYHRGMRKGMSIIWGSKQKISLREESAK